MHPSTKLPREFRDDHRYRTKPNVSPSLYLRTSMNLRGKNCRPRPAIRNTRHDVKISGTLYRLVPPRTALYRLVPYISEKLFFHRSNPESETRPAPRRLPAFPRQNMPKNRVFPLIPTSSRVLDGGGVGMEMAKFVHLQSNQSSQVKPSQAKSCQVKVPQTLKAAVAPGKTC